MADLTRTIDEWGVINNVRLAGGIEDGAWQDQVTFQEFTNMIDDYGYTSRTGIDKITEDAQKDEYLSDTNT